MAGGSSSGRHNVQAENQPQCSHVVVISIQWVSNQFSVKKNNTDLLVICYSLLALFFVTYHAITFQKGT